MLIKPYEKRISIRTSLMGVTAKISKDGNTWEDVAEKDISDSGIGFEAVGDHNVNDILKIEFDVSDHVHKMSFACDIKVKFKTGRAEGKHFYGAKFQNISKSDHTSLAVLIELLATRYPTLLMQ
ncbi:MAG: PilZ domain-containing protein [Defluviitaleaceae bacterium]|nr:PilZ domain-containing protein [Defluviitaleaceae bacterium]